LAREWTFLAIRGLLRRFHPQIAGTRPESLFRWLGFFERPEPAEIIANYLRGYVLFGRNTRYGEWFHWYTVPERSVITRQTAQVPRRKRGLLQSGKYEFRYDQDVEQIIRFCQNGRDGWLTESIVRVYLDMQKLGFATSLGTYHDGRLVGGFWGLSVGRVFCIMSMFHFESNAGSVALSALSDEVRRGGRWSIIDCVGPKEHWDRYGAQNLSVRQFSALVTSQLFDPGQSLNYSRWTKREPSSETIDDRGEASWLKARPAELPSTDI
jgi:leucyl/phenylalanyl-tRNA--protein transferase